MTERWKDIPGYEGRYQVSNLYRVRSLRRTVICNRNGTAGSQPGRAVCSLCTLTAATGGPTPTCTTNATSATSTTWPTS